MANACRVHSDSAVDMCDALVDRCEEDTPPATIELFASGSTPPAYCDDSEAGSEVATCTCNNPAFGAAAKDGVNYWAESDLDVDPAVQDASCTGGTPDYFRIKTGTAGNAVLQGTVGTASVDLVLNTATIGAGAQLDITSFQVRVPYNQP